mgnify:CR=1 FL=1
MSVTIQATDSMLLGALRNLYEQGEITLEQFGGCLRRYVNRKFEE